MTTAEDLNETPEPTNEEAMDSLTAGYNKQRGIEPTAETVTPTETAPVVEPEVPEAPQPSAAPSVDDRFADLLAHVSRVEDISAKAHGKIGELNRTIQQLQQRPQPQADGELSPDVVEALKQAEAVAEEFPELAGPLVNVMRALTKRSAPAVVAPATEAPDIDTLVSQRVAQERAQEALEILADDHPDWSTVRTTPEYKAWLDTKDAASRDKFLSSMNPFYVSKQLTEFKTWRTAAQAAAAATAAAEQKKRERLEGAVTPEGEGASGPSKLPDSAGLAAGYNKVRRLRTA